MDEQANATLFHGGAYNVGDLLVLRTGYNIRDEWSQVQVVAVDCGMVGFISAPMGRIDLPAVHKKGMYTPLPRYLPAWKVADKYSRTKGDL